jgi:hypothetical protein
VTGTPREPARDWYDAAVGLVPNPEHLPQVAYAVVKVTYELRDGAVALAPPEPLLHDIWNDETLQPRFPEGSDYWFDKPAADVVLRGSVFAPGGRPFQYTTASLKIGDRTKRVAVFGQRFVEWTATGEPRFTTPEAVNKMPLLYQVAYGGLDARVPIPEAVAADYDILLRAGQAYDHPGLYPRNPVGKGYVALHGAVPGLELPNLEDPSDLLTPERLTQGAPELWYRQPLPCCFEWLNGLVFPRCRYLGLDAWYPGPETVELPEVARGYLPADFSRQLQASPQLTVAYRQEASLGLTYASDLSGQRVEIHGMHPEEQSLGFTVPPPPQLHFDLEGNRQPVLARLTNFVIMPNERRFTVTYAAITPLHRVFIPGVHRVIPIAVSVNGDRPVAYQPPLPIKDRLQSTQGASST